MTQQPRGAWALAEILPYPVFWHLNYYSELNILKNKHLAWQTIYNTLWPPPIATSVYSSSVTGSISPLWESSHISSFLSRNKMNLSKITPLRYDNLNLKLHFSLLSSYSRNWTSAQGTNDHPASYFLWTNVTLFLSICCRASRLASNALLQLAGFCE